jgi:hypothetical protein
MSYELRVSGLTVLTKKKIRLTIRLLRKTRNSQLATRLVQNILIPPNIFPKIQFQMKILQPESYQNTEK